LWLFIELAQALIKKVGKEANVSIFLIFSESDITINQKELKFLAFLKHQPKSWYFRFEKDFEITHNCDD
jgi:hypothetical protein